MAKLLDNSQLVEIWLRVQDELKKRGVFAQIVSFDEVEGRRGNPNRIEFHTEEFDTIPVIFDTIYVDNFGGSVRKEKTQKLSDGEIIEFEGIKVWIPVHFSYTHFGGGSNTCEVFTLTCDAYSIDREYQEGGINHFVYNFTIV